VKICATFTPMSNGAKIGLAVVLSVLVVGGGVGYMVYTTVASGEALEYYKHVDEIMEAPAQWRGRRVQLHGNVVAGTIVKRGGSLDFKFALHRQGKWVEVAYVGIVPDAFKDCAELVVKGQLTDDQTFKADTISAKCPSKYDGKRQPGVCGESHRETVLAHRAR
jgi:cytochrome c-type biogenesis protein CcmE